MFAKSQNPDVRFTKRTICYKCKTFQQNRDILFWTHICQNIQENPITCLTTHAKHVEMAGDLSTDSFLMSLRRFISRRGNISITFSDNGTNLVSAEKELRLALKNVDFDLVTSKLSPYNTAWKFNPPSSLWMGGM